ncbi:MAG: sugar phosphate isomerase/epimerase family protein [bacterium]
MEIGISTGILYKNDLIESLRLIKEAGFDNIEVWAGIGGEGKRVHYDYHDWDYTRRLKEKLKELTLRVVSLHAPFSEELDISRLEEERRDFAVSEIEKAIDVLGFLGGNILVFHPSTAPSHFENLIQKMYRLSQAKKSISEILKYCQDNPIKLALENQLPDILCGYSVDLLRLIWEINSRKVGICLDTSHANLSENVSDVVKKFKDWIISLHISDNFGTSDDHNIPGKGNINWQIFVQTLKLVEYKGVFMLELLEQGKGWDSQKVLREALGSVKQIPGVKV